MRVVILDSTTLGVLANPNKTHVTNACNDWMEGLLDKGERIILPAVADYEVRRELIRANKLNSLKKLDVLCESLIFLNVTPEAMKLAATLWAQARNMGKPTADNKKLDGDMILVAQALTLDAPKDDVVIATANVGHLSLFVNAQIWQDIA